MRRRDKTGDNAAKAIRPKTSKRGSAPKIAGCRSSPVSYKDTDVARLTRERDEAVERQTATAEILDAISGSPTDTQPVFDAIVRSGLKLFPGAATTIVLPDGDRRVARAVAIADEDPEREKAWRSRFPTVLDRTQMQGTAILDCRVIDFPDVKEHVTGPMAPGAKNFLASGYRAITIMPMIRGKTAIGAISVVRMAPGPLSEKQRDLLKTFAAQAVIAIENTRLLNELRESLQQQTATSDVLKVISSSPTDIQPVLESILQTAGRLCEAEYACFFRLQDGRYHLAGSNNAKADYIKYLSEHPINVDRGTVVGRAAVECRTVHIPDCLADPEYTAHENARIGKHRSLLGVPLLRDGIAVGVIGLLRTSVKPYTDKQVELVETFADQAVIAIENTRLLSELRHRTDDLSESLEQQTATSEVLKVISSSPGEVEAVFNSILDNAVRICGARFANLVLYDRVNLRVVAMHNAPPEFEKIRKANPIVPLHGSAVATLVQTKERVHILDLAALPAFASSPLITAARARSMLAVPMLKDDELIGGINIYRQEVKPFTDKQIALLENFAAQAVIAIENARLLNELRQRTHELATSLDELRNTQDRLVQTQKLALLGQLTAGIAHEIKNPLNFVNNFSGISAELIDELQDTLKGMPLDDKSRADINELTGTLKSNFDKVVHHGRRADAIVKNMLQHSREGSGEHRVIDINALVDESLNLAWHGARAETQGFEIKLRQSFDPSAGEADIFPQDIRRALLNMISNGFYAATKRRAETNGGDYEPMLTASTKNLGDRVEIKIRDNGTGMTADVKEKMFNPFFTTKPTGEGTGLGLSISHDIIVKQHGGSIEVDTKPGEFTEIRVTLPRVVALLPERS